MSYRISRLPRLPAPIDRMKFRKALSAMSVHPVNRSWLQSEAGLSPHEVDSLLTTLGHAGVLEGPFPDDDPAPRPARRGTWQLLAQLVRSRFTRKHDAAPPAAPAAAPPAGLPGWLDAVPPQTQQRIAEELRGLLARHPHARKVLAHLSMLESTLRQKTPAAAHALPIAVLRQALSQLRALGIPEHDAALALLRSRLMRVVLQHDDADDAALQRDVEVAEVGLSRFIEAQQLWDQQTLPMRH